MTGLSLVSTGFCLPDKVVTNTDLEKLVDTSDEWIITRSGIRERHYIEEGDRESTSTMAIAAARMAMERAGLSTEDIGCCVCGTVSEDYACPNTSALVHEALGLREDIPVMDVNAACSGFVYSTIAAKGMLLETGNKYALVIGSESLTRHMDMTDRSTCVLFGDGAGAAIYKLTEDTPYASILGARGGREILTPGSGTRDIRIKMDGRAVFRFAVEAIPRCIGTLLSKSGLSLDDISWVVLHQANERIIDHCIKKLNAPAEKFFINIDHMGNTSAASIPLALSEMEGKGLFEQGQKLMIVSFGGGLTWAGALITYGK